MGNGAGDCNDQPAGAGVPLQLVAPRPPRADPASDQSADQAADRGARHPTEQDLPGTPVAGGALCLSSAPQKPTARNPPAAANATPPTTAPSTQRLRRAAARIAARSGASRSDAPGA